MKSKTDRPVNKLGQELIGAALDESPKVVSSIYQPEILQVLNGVQLRNKKDRDVLLTRIANAINEQIRRTGKMEQEYFAGIEKRLYQRIAELEAALRLEQQRHFEDIAAFARGGDRGWCDQGQATTRASHL